MHFWSRWFTLSVWPRPIIRATESRDRPQGKFFFTPYPRVACAAATTTTTMHGTWLLLLLLLPRPVEASRIAAWPQGARGVPGRGASVSLSPLGGRSAGATQPGATGEGAGRKLPRGREGGQMSGRTERESRAQLDGCPLIDSPRFPWAASCSTWPGRWVRAIPVLLRS